MGDVIETSLNIGVEDELWLAFDGKEDRSNGIVA